MTKGGFDAYTSCNRTGELGLTRAAGHRDQHKLELVLTVPDAYRSAVERRHQRPSGGPAAIQARRRCGYVA